MAALTQDLGLEITGNAHTTESYKVKGSVVIYVGATVAFDAGGFIVPAANTIGLRVAGIAMSAANTTGLADGLRSVQVGEGRFTRAFTGVTQAMAGKKVYVADDQTVTATIGNGVLAGIFRRFEPSGLALIEMGAYLTAINV